jgi:hypothetical protein
MEKYISKEYLDKIVDFRDNKYKTWGGAVTSKVPQIYERILKEECKSVLDYGSGNSDFKNTVEKLYPDYNFEIVEYEPSIPELNVDPAKCDMTICVDVLEHIEPDKIDNVLSHIIEKTNKICFLSICVVESHGQFDDGTNLHLIVEPVEWWIKKLEEKFNMVSVLTTKFHLMTWVEPKTLTVYEKHFI